MELGVECGGGGGGGVWERVTGVVGLLACTVPTTPPSTASAYSRSNKASNNLPVCVPGTYLHVHVFYI